MAVNPGDPITSELMANLVSNINIINSLSSSVVDTSSGSGDANIGQLAVESNRILVPCSMDGKGEKAVDFTKTFTKAPYVTCTIYQGSGKNFIKFKYQPVITAISTTGFTVRMMPVGATGNGNIYVHWIAVG